MTTGFRADTGFKVDQARSDTWIPGSAGAGTYSYGDPITNEDRLFAMTRDPIGFRVVVIPALDALDEWFNLVPTENEEPDEVFDQKLQKALSELNAKSELSKLLIFTNCFGWAILLKSYVETKMGTDQPLEDPSDIIKLTAYSPMQVSSWIIDKTPLKEDGSLNKNYGKPLYYYINLGGVKRIQVHYSRITLITNLQLGAESESWQGSSDLDAIMDDLITLRNEAWAMGETLYRFVAPFFDLAVEGAEAPYINALNADRKFDNMMLRKHFIHTSNHVLKTIGFEGRGIQNPQNFYQPPLERISTKTNIPQGLLRGVQSGAVTGSETDIKNYFKGCVSNKQRLIEPTIRALIDEIAAIKNIQLGDYKFDWPSPFQLSELEKANIDEIKARTISVKKDWLTKDELRELDDPNLGPLPAGQGGNELVQKQLPNPFKSPLATQDQDEEGRWITIEGTHIFIREGESVEAAFERTTGKKLEGGMKGLSKGNEPSSGEGKNISISSTEKQISAVFSEWGKEGTNPPPDIGDGISTYTIQQFTVKYPNAKITRLGKYGLEATVEEPDPHRPGKTTTKTFTAYASRKR